MTETTMARQLKYLTRMFSVAYCPSSAEEWIVEDQVDHFLEYGYIVIKNAFSKEKADEWTKNIWFRLNMDASDKSTWNRERVHMPFQRREKVATFAPKVIHNPSKHERLMQYINRLGLQLQTC